MGHRFCLALLMGVFGISAQTPPATAGKPAPARDLTGVWMVRNPPSMRSFQLATFTPDEPELTDWAKAKYREAKSSNSGQYTLDTTNDPVLTRCDPPGVPRVYFHPYPFEFVQTPKSVLMLYEYDHMVRRIYTDGRQLEEDPDLTWMGHSIGHWENDATFVVESNGFNDRTWLDRLGHPHSTELHVTERFRRIDYDHMELDFTFTDPKALVKPWQSTFYLELRPEWELGEISCSGDYLQFNSFEH
jgi:hypothetical protein